MSEVKERTISLARQANAGSGQIAGFVIVGVTLLAPLVARAGEGELRLKGGTPWGIDVVKEIADQYVKVNSPSPAPTIARWGDVKNIERFCSDECEILVHRATPTAEERLLLQKRFPADKPQPETFIVGYAKVAVIVNRNNTVRGMTSVQLRALLNPKGKGMQWSLFGGSGGVVNCYAEGREATSRLIIRHACMMLGPRYPTGFYGFRDDCLECKDAEEVVKKVRSDTNGIGIILYQGQPLTGVKPLSLASTSDGALVDLKEGSFIQDDYLLSEPVLLYLHPDASIEARRLCEFAVGREGAKIAAKFGLITPLSDGESVGAERLAEMKAHKGQRVPSVGMSDCQASMLDLATEYVTAKATVQMGYSATESDTVAIGAFTRLGPDTTTASADSAADESASVSSTPASMPASALAVPKITPFVRSGGKELLFLDGKPGDVAVKLHGDKWNALGPDGTGPVEYVLAGRAVAVIVNPANKIESLTMDQVRMVFSGEIDDWATFGQTGRAAPVARPGIGKAETKINRFGLKMTDPVVAIFSRGCLQPVNYGRVTLKKDSNDVIAAVGMDPQAIGFVDLAACSNRPLGVNSGAEGAENPYGGTANVKVLAIQVGMGEKAKIMRPTEENIRNAMYPLSQRLYLYVHPKASDVAKDFAKFLATCGGSEATPYADTVKSVMDAYQKHGLIPLADAAIERRAKDAAAAARAAAAKAEKEKAAGGKATKKPAR